MALRFNEQKGIQLATAGVDGLSVLDIYTGPQPASGSADATGTLLVSITGIQWADGNPATLDGEPEAVAVAGGEAGWGRFRNPEDTLRMDGAVGSEFTVEVDGQPSTTIIEGSRVSLISAELTQPLG